MYDTGARISEVLALEPGSIDFDKGTVRLFEPKTMNHRVTTLSLVTMDIIRDYLEHGRKPRNEEEGKFLFLNSRGTRLKARIVQIQLQKISGRILGPEKSITPHYFRAACAVHLLENGVGIREVQEIIGWKCLSTAQEYTRVVPQRMAHIKREHHPSFQNQDAPKFDFQEETVFKLKEQLKAEKESFYNQQEIEREQFTNMKARYDDHIHELLETITKQNKVIKGLIKNK